MAKYTRGAVKIDWLKNPRVEIAIPRAIRVTPGRPRASCITADAGVLVSASPLAPKALTHTKLTLTYNAITPATPISSPRGRFFRGSTTSPEMKLAVCQPPYANKTGIIAVPNDDSKPSDIGWSSTG